METRLEKFERLAKEPFYKNLCLNLTEYEFDLLVDFISDNQNLAPGEYKTKAVLYFSETPGLKHPKEMAELMLASC